MRNFVVPLLVCSALVAPISSAQDRNLVVSKPPKALGEQRVALVIGNSAYKSSPLTNPINDARAMSRVLRESGF